MPWHEPEDLKVFKRLTVGHPVLMGRRTHTSIGRALPGRRNLVLSRDPDARVAPGCERYTSLADALRAARRESEMPFVIGGATLYAEALPLATHLFITEIDRTVERADTWFLAWPRAAFEEQHFPVAVPDVAHLRFRCFRRITPSRRGVAK